jgi:hypothetical protein
MLDVSYKHDPEANFKSYVTYDLMDNEAMELTGAARNQFAGRREVMQDELIKALNRNMQALGFELDENDPDILVAYYVGVRDEIFVADFGYEYSFMATSSDVQSVRDGAMRVDLVDTESKKVVWSGEGHGAVNRDPSEEIIRTNVNRAVDKIMKQYPPKKSPYAR